MLSQRVGAPSFFRLHRIPLCKCTIVFSFSFVFNFYCYSIRVVCTYHSFLIHSFADGHLGCFQHLAIVNCAAMNIEVHRIFGLVFQGSQGIIPAVELWGQKAIPFLVFWGNSILFYTVAVPVCIPTNSALGFPFLHNLTSTCQQIFLEWPLG